MDLINHQREGSILIAERHILVAFLPSRYNATVKSLLFGERHAAYWLCSLAVLLRCLIRSPFFSRFSHPIRLFQVWQLEVQEILVSNISRKRTTMSHSVLFYSVYRSCGDDNEIVLDGQGRTLLSASARSGRDASAVLRRRMSSSSLSPDDLANRMA